MSLPESVVAVEPEAGGGLLHDQSHPPEAVLTGHEGLMQATTSAAEWVWLVGAGIRPEREALERLLAAAAPPGEPVAALVAGMVRDPRGRAVGDCLPAPRYGDEAAVIRLVAHRLLPIRHAPFVNCLVRRACFEQHGVPDRDRFGPHAATAWTAAVLEHAPGYLAPSSVVHLPGGDASASRAALLAAAAPTIRMVNSGAWTRGESFEALTRLGRRLIDPGRR